MKLKSPATIILVTAVLTSWASAGIPEPSAVLYGTITIDGQPVTATDDVTVIARVDGITQPIGSYHMGDIAPAGDNYALRIRLEAVPAGTQPSGNAAQVGQTVRIFIRKDGGCEVEAGTYTVLSRGAIQERNLSASGIPEVPDVDGDGDNDLADYAALQRCFTGADNGPVGQGCAAANRDGDNDVDLSDYAGISSCTTGPS